MSIPQSKVSQTQLAARSSTEIPPCCRTFRGADDGCAWASEPCVCIAVDRRDTGTGAPCHTPSWCVAATNPCARMTCRNGCNRIGPEHDDSRSSVAADGTARTSLKERKRRFSGVRLLDCCFSLLFLGPIDILLHDNVVKALLRRSIFATSVG